MYADSPNARETPAATIKKKKKAVWTQIIAYMFTPKTNSTNMENIDRRAS